MSKHSKFIYLHGFSSGPSSYKAQYFKQKIDKTFHTNTDVPDLNLPSFHQLNFSAQIETMLNNYQNEDEIIMIGSSLGAYLALMLNQSGQLNIKAMILLATAFEFVERRQDDMSEGAYANWLSGNDIEVYHHQYKRNEKLSAQLIIDGQKHRFKPEQLTLSTLAVHGRQDDVVDYSLSQKYFSGLENVELILIDSDHSLIDHIDFIWDKSEVFIRRALGLS